MARDACAATAALYGRVGFDPPWVGYLALSGRDVVGTCAFKTGPRGGKTEIAYFTFPSFEGQGIATAMARALIEIARTADRTIELTAQTLPEPNASNAILRKLGFQFLGPVDVPEDGTVWEWHLSPVQGETSGGAFKARRGFRRGTPATGVVCKTWSNVIEIRLAFDQETPTRFP